MHIISPPSFCLSGLLNQPRLRSKKKFFDLGEALAYLTGHSGRRGGGFIICILGLKKCLTITTNFHFTMLLLFYILHKKNISEMHNVPDSYEQIVIKLANIIYI
jgi:hypothetical protein